MIRDARVALITGSSSGVGAASARRFAGEGWNVVVTYWSNEEGAREVAAGCREVGAGVAVVGGDVAEDVSCREMVRAAQDRWGRLDAVINNAGTTKFCPQDDLDCLDARDFHRIYGVNVVGPYQVTRAAAPLLGSSGDGSVVNVASMAGLTGIGSSTAYAASKGALVTMTRSLARALGPEVRVNAVCPGFIQGDWLRGGLGEERYERVKAQREAGAALRMTVTHDMVADTVYYLAAEARGVTGDIVRVDGGHHLAGGSITP